MSYKFKERWLDRALHRRHFEAFVVFLIMFSVMLIVLNLYGTGTDAANRTVCRENLRRLVQALELYFQDYDSTYPPPANWVRALVAYSEGLDVFFCPSDERPRTRRERYAPAVSYWYRQPETNRDAGSSIPAFGDIMFSNWVGNHVDGGNVAYLDGRVWWHDIQQWQQRNLPVEPLLKRQRTRE